MTTTSKIPVYIINLESDLERRELMLDQLSDIDDLEVEFVPAINGSSLSEIVCMALVQEERWVAERGTIACFLSHVRAWEMAAAFDGPFCVIVEDDVTVTGLSELHDIEVPEDADLIFLNDRMASGADGDGLTVLPLLRGLERLDRLRNGGAGGDGYLITPSGAQKALAACAKDLFYGHMDGRLLRYAATDEDLALLAPDSWIATVIRHHHHPRMHPAIGILTGYCLSQPLVVHRGIASSRERRNQVDEAELGASVTAPEPVEDAPAPRKPRRAKGAPD